MSGIASYAENSVSMQTGGKLIVLLYDGAIKFLKLAISEMEANRHMEKGEYINRAQAIITELNSSLDMEGGGEVAENLRKLYTFMSRHLAEANLKRDPRRVRDVIACLSDLNEGWKAITA